MKKAWLSKTLWANLIIALAPLVPGAKEQIVAHPELILLAVAGVNALLRAVTKDKLHLMDEGEE